MTIDEIRAAHFPISVGDQYEIRALEAQEAWPIASSLTPRVFTPLPELGLMPYEPAAPLLAEALNRHNEFLIVYNSDNEPIGWSFGNQQDPDTFFMMWTGILPEYQNQGIYSAFLRGFIDYCRALGYARITSNHLVNNRRVIVAKMKAGFVASGFELDERWGAMLRLTYFVDDNRMEGFRQAFSLERYD